jgi:cytochrome c-type biogenesis protein CcmH
MIQWFWRTLILIVVLISLPALAVEPSEMLEDPALEARARDISKGLRCLVCRNESIDESNADLAKDLRVLVRERIILGDSNTQTVDFIVARYGEYVLLKPRFSVFNLGLWLAGPILLLGGIGVAAGNYRKRSKQTDTALSKDEEARLKEILDNTG